MKESTYILVVDDEQSILDSFAETFSEEGYDVTKAQNWFEATQHIKTRQYNIIIADVRLADVSYQDMIDDIKEENKYANTLAYLNLPGISQEKFLKCLES